MSAINPFKNIRIEYHILQSFPVTCLNRDDVGSPKTAIVGGVTRARVSSQCWKRYVRLAMQEFGVKLAIRTKRVSDLVEKACCHLGATDEQGKACGNAIAAALTKDTLHFLTETEVNAFAEFAKELLFDSAKIKAKEIHALAKKVIRPALDGMDIALFGRMVAQAAELNIEAAASFAHAISTHKVANEIEFFTAMDDMADEPGSAHMGSLEFNSATYYRYISLDLGQLWETVGAENLVDSVNAFTKALYVAIPGARQTTQSGAGSWDFAKILIRKGQRLQVPFDAPIKSKGEGYLEQSIAFLQHYLHKKEKLSGSLFAKQRDYEFGLDENFSIDDLIEALSNYITELLV